MVRANGGPSLPPSGTMQALMMLEHMRMIDAAHSWVPKTRVEYQGGCLPLSTFLCGLPDPATTPPPATDCTPLKDPNFTHVFHQAKHPSILLLGHSGVCWLQWGKVALLGPWVF
jgi:hypothetical protein